MRIGHLMLGLAAGLALGACADMRTGSDPGGRAPAVSGGGTGAGAGAYGPGAGRNAYTSTSQPLRVPSLGMNPSGGAGGP
ncbi:hypothetical protein [Paracraurococcus lichenis]|uniref:Lipoprotein n=1 Tax=Paracraurococcus lichenis TaxID=3064888 RepID=A0ABT9E508_9PROT|nr:hypothetical protein [Paracraurococcus sp. LOR1-02]MDO9711265.1 hypothetical protein [Paracraurococcus sp. LOR1-02]